LNPHFKHHLTELAKNLQEKQRMDNIIPQILRDLSSKPSEYVKEVTPLLKEFAAKLEEMKKSFEQNLFKDSSNRTLYANIDKEDATKVRASRYGLNITSGELSSLKLGRVLHPFIIKFYLSFLSEKTEKNNAKLGDLEKIYISDKVFDVYRGDGQLYAEIGKDNSIIFAYKRLGFLVAIDDSHIILVEVRRTDKELHRELIIYNSDVKQYEIFHNKIYSLFRSCMGFDEPSTIEPARESFYGTRTSFRKTDFAGRTFTTSIQKNNVLELKVANCPQQLNPYDSAVYACKNATLLCADKKITQGTYSQNDINLFRYEIFNTIVKIGTNNDANLVDLDV